MQFYCVAAQHSFPSRSYSKQTVRSLGMVHHFSFKCWEYNSNLWDCSWLDWSFSLIWLAIEEVRIGKLCNRRSSQATFIKNWKMLMYLFFMSSLLLVYIIPNHKIGALGGETASNNLLGVDCPSKALCCAICIAWHFWYFILILVLYL